MVYKYTTSTGGGFTFRNGRRSGPDEIPVLILRRMPDVVMGEEVQEDSSQRIELRAWELSVLATSTRSTIFVEYRPNLLGLLIVYDPSAIDEPEILQERQRGLPGSP